MLVHLIPVDFSHVKSLIPNKAVYISLEMHTDLPCLLWEGGFYDNIKYILSPNEWGTDNSYHPNPRLLNLLVKIHSLLDVPSRSSHLQSFLHNYIYIYTHLPRYGHCTQVFPAIIERNSRPPKPRSRQPDRPLPHPSLEFHPVCSHALFLSLVKRAPLPQLFT